MDLLRWDYKLNLKLSSLVELQKLTWEDLITDLTWEPRVELKIKSTKTVKITVGWEKIIHLLGDQTGQEKDKMKLYAAVWINY